MGRIGACNWILDLISPPCGLLLGPPRQLPPTGLWALFFVVLTTGDCSLFHQKNFGGFFGRFRSLLRRAPRRQWSLWSNSQVFAASLLGSSTFSIFSGVLLWTRPRPALTGRYTGHASRAVPFPRPSSPQKPRGSSATASTLSPSW